MTLPKEKKDYSYEVWDVASLTDNSYFNSEEGNAYIDFVYDHYLQIPSELEEIFDNTLYSRALSNSFRVYQLCESVSFEKL